VRTSDDRILTTHVGSLPRSTELTALLLKRDAGVAVAESDLKALVQACTVDTVRKQIAAGIDIVNDGEQPRAGFSTQIVSRMSGFGVRSASRRRQATDYTRFPGFAEYWKWMFRGIEAHSHNQPQAVGELRYLDLAPVRSECDQLNEALSALSAVGTGVVEAFFTSPSPGIISTTMENAYYDSHERYVFALARELRKEYEAIVDAGLILQIDAPDLALERNILFQDASDAEFLKIMELHIAALNEALVSIPAERIRLHVCWGAWGRPHADDIALETILPTLLSARVGALSIPFATPRHQHEYEVLRRIRLPDQLVFIPGVIDNTTNIVEHPKVVARRIEEAVDVLGDRSRVIAGTDCGFGTFAGFEQVAKDVVFAKLASCRQGADLATQRLWGKPVGQLPS
jgi:5-methyltetrahydropteroyltriglutamate--homocysteine methyltransferase